MKKVYCFYLHGSLIAWTINKSYANKYRDLSSAKMKKEYMEKKYELPIFMNKYKELMLTEIILTDEFNDTYTLISTPADDEHITQFIESCVSSLEDLMHFLSHTTYIDNDSTRDIVFTIYNELVYGGCYNIDTLELYLYQQLKKGQLKT